MKSKQERPSDQSVEEELKKGGPKVDGRRLRARSEDVEKQMQEEEETRQRKTEESKKAAKQQAEEQAQKAEALNRAEQELAGILRQLSVFLALQQEQRNNFWNFLPRQRRERHRLEEQIQELRTRERVARMRIAEITGEYHRDVAKKEKQKKVHEAVEPFFNAVREARPVPPAPPAPEEAIKEKTNVMRMLSKEKVQLEAERESVFMAFRPFRKRAIDQRLAEIQANLEELQKGVRKARNTP